MGEIKINNIVYGTDNASSIIYKDTTVEEKLDTIPIFDPSDNQHVEANQYDYLTYGHIVDNLNSTEDDKVLSAKQGKALNDRIESVTEKNSEDIEDLMITVNTLKNINKMSQATYDALPEDEKNTGIYVITDAEGLTAKTLEYDDSKTGFGVNNVQDAIDNISEHSKAVYASILDLTGANDIHEVTKYGNVVQIEFRSDNVQIQYGNAICQLPEGYKPTKPCYLFGKTFLPTAEKYEYGIYRIATDGYIYQEIAQVPTSYHLLLGCFII